MTRRDVLCGLGGIVLAGSAGAQQARPNVIWIMADDLGWGDLGCYGQQRIRTPNIDRLAAEGMRFTDAYAGSTVCAPSRCALMTGRHNGHGRVRDNIPHGVFLRPDDVTVAEALKQAGYATGGFGKWSLGNPGSRGVPLYQGFDEYTGQLNQDQAHQYYPHYLWNNDKVELQMGNRAGERGQYSADVFAERALDFIDRHRERPFFLYFPTTLPHWSDYGGADSQMVPSDEPYTDRDWPQVEKNYAAMVTRLDTQVGAILDRIERHGLASNTLVFFTSDNGASAEREHSPEFFASGGGLRGHKRDMYEGGIRVPLIARWPGRIAAGSESSHVCAFWDFLPTAADVAGLPAIAGSDGISFLPALLGAPQPTHEYLYWDYGHVRGKFIQAARAGKWKGVRAGPEAPVEVYDLESDRAEQHDVASANPELMARFEAIFAEAFVATPDYPVKR